MTAATALVSGNTPLPQLAEEAVSQALRRSGLTRATGVLLFLTPEFARHAQQAVTAVARAAQCMQVAGGIAAGVFTESGWVLDRPAAAVMVFGAGLSLGPPDDPAQPILSWAGSTFPSDWHAAGPGNIRFGGTFSGSVGHADPVAWQQSRLSPEQRCSVQLLGAHTALCASSGLRLLSPAQRVDASNAYDLEALGGRRALDSLNRALPPEYRDAGLRASCHDRAALPLQYLTAVLIDGEDAAAALREGRYRPVPIIGASAERDNLSLTLTERVVPGQYLAWAIRQPVSAEQDMRQTLDRLDVGDHPPVCALMFSCIGRGPYFYGGEDRDLDIARQRFPGLPLLGAYGTGQIAPAAKTATEPAGDRNRQLQNAVVTALVSKTRKEAHVQSVAR